MTHDIALPPAHPTGELSLVESDPVVIDTYNGAVHVEWDSASSMTPLGQLGFFVQYLKTAGLFDAYVADCPLAYRSPNAPKTRDVLGTLLLSVLSGHWRYAHIGALRGDTVATELLGMKKIISDDAARRGLKAIDVEAGAIWQHRHLDYCTAPLLAEPWVLDVDTTIKPLYGHQEGAVVGYNPHKPGRPSHVYHTYAIARLRLVLDVDVTAGNQHTSNHTAPGLWGLLDRTPPDCWPRLLRGDAGFGNEAMMREAEGRALPYLFKQRQTARIKRVIARLQASSHWVHAGQGWYAHEATARLEGWSRERRLVVLRRRIGSAMTSQIEARRNGQLALNLIEITSDQPLHDYIVLVTSLEEDIDAIGQLYRDRGDAENTFDELKNQWGWAGYTTRDLARCGLMARNIALVYNWWNIFVRLAEPDKHLEAITSRPLLLLGIAERVRHARRTSLRIASCHERAGKAAAVLKGIATFLTGLVETAPQLNSFEQWRQILARAFCAFLKGRQLRLPPRLGAT